MIVAKPDHPVRGETIRVLEVRTAVEPGKDRLRVRLDTGRETYFDASTGFSIGDLGVAMFQGDEFIGTLNLGTGQYSFTPYQLGATVQVLLWIMLIPVAFLTFGISAAIAVLLFISANRLAAKREAEVDKFVRRFARQQ